MAPGDAANYLIPASEKLKNKLTQPPAKGSVLGSEVYFGGLPQLTTKIEKIIPFSTDKRATSPESEVLAEKRLAISKELEKSVTDWFVVTSANLGLSYVKKEIGDFLGGLEKSAEASEPTNDNNNPRAPQNYRSQRLYQLLKSLVSGKGFKEAEPKDYANFDLKGGLSMYEFMSSLAEKAEAEKNKKASSTGEVKPAAQEQLLSFKNEDIFLCPAGHAIHRDALGSASDCPRHGVTLDRENMGRSKHTMSTRRDYFLMKEKDGRLGWTSEIPPILETDVLTKDGKVYRATIMPPSVVSAPSGKQGQN